MVFLTETDTACAVQHSPQDRILSASPAHLMDTFPDIALLVATCDRKELLNLLLESLSRQTCANFTVYIGDQNTASYLDDVIALHEKSMRIERCLVPRQGLSAVRNILLERALGNNHDWMAFPDDDCRYEADTLEKLAELSARRPDVDGVLCALQFDEGPLVGSTTALINRFNAFHASETFVQFYRTSAVRAIGRFDPALGPGTGLPYGCGEDTDYVLRALEKGLRLVRAPDILVRHPAPKLRGDGLEAKWLSYGQGRMYLLRKHGFPLWFKLANVAFPLVKALCEGPQKWSYRKHMFLGRWRGFWDKGPARTDKSSC